MFRSKFLSLAMAAVLFAAAASLPTGIRAETKVGSSVESRILLGFKANDAAVQAMMPEGWKAITLPKGPVAGANLLVLFMDRQLLRDAEDKPMTPSNGLASVAVAYGVNKNVEGVRLFVTEVYEPAPLANAYGNSTAAVLSMSGGSAVGVEGDANYNVSFAVTPETGGEIKLDLFYKSGTPGLSKGLTAMPYSAANPDFHRIYRYDQMVELLKSDALGKPLDGHVEYSITTPELAAAFDGSEALVTILAIPLYVRDVFLP